MRWVDRYFRWHLIEADPDDNAFVDCAIASGADALVTEDRHCDVLAEVDFPTVPVFDIARFEAWLLR